MKTGYYLKCLTPEMMKLLESTKNKISMDKNGDNTPHLEITVVVLVQFNIANNDYQQDSRVLYTFVPNKSICQLLDSSPKNCTFLKSFGSKFSYIQVWFTDKNSNLLEIENKIKITLVKV